MSHSQIFVKRSSELKKTLFNLKDGINPYPHQIEGANFALSNFYTMNTDDPGLGKTLQALMAIAKSGKRALVIVPSSLLLNWQEEIKNCTNLLPYIYDHRNPEPLWQFDIVLMSYYQLTGPEEAKVKKAKKGELPPVITSQKDERVLPWWERVITEVDFDFIVIDESHNFKNPTAIRTNAALNVVQKVRPKYLLLLTGTPIKNRLPDFYIPLYMLAMGEKVTNKITNKYKSMFTFCYHFCHLKQTGRKQEFIGMKNVDELKTYLVDRKIGRDKDKVLDLPEYIEKMVTVDYKEPDLEEAFRQFNAGIVGVDISVKAESARLKAPFTAEYSLDLLEQGAGPLVIFSDHREPVGIIADKIRAKGYKVAEIMGGTTPAMKQKIKDSFQAGELDVIVGTIGAMSEGITLTRASHMVFNDFPWVPSSLQQAMDRIRRIGQLNRCVYHFVVGAVADKRIFKLIKDKLKVIKAVMS